MRRVLEHIKLAGLTISPDKCERAKKEVLFLGYLINEDGIYPYAEKIAAIQLIHITNCKRDIQVFMGMANYYRRFVRGFPGVVAPINKLLRNDEPWAWGNEQEAAFIKIK